MATNALRHHMQTVAELEQLAGVRPHCCTHHHRVTRQPVLLQLVPHVHGVARQRFKPDGCEASESSKAHEPALIGANVNEQSGAA